MPKKIFFFIGTEAELIKMFPVIIECKNRNIEYHIIASGQNDIKSSRIFQKINCGNVELELSEEKNIRKNALGLLQWFVFTYIGAASKIRKFYNMDLEHMFMIVHGDTVSTLMGALLGKKLGMCVCHVEAGLRSHNILNPFPEELDRILTSKKTNLHFAPGKQPSKNLKGVRGKVINTELNTIIDSLQFSLDIPIESNIENYLKEDYFVFVMHRQENLADRKFVYAVVEQISKIARERKCIMILHEITKCAIIKFGLMKKLEEDNNIVLQARVDYFDFMKLLNSAKFVITDGGSNQEELFYMGKPCLILRKATERNEGIGMNAILYEGDVTIIKEFSVTFKKKEIEKKSFEVSPSRIIVDSIIGGAS